MSYFILLGGIIVFNTEFNFWKNDREARKIVKEKVSEVNVKENIGLSDWHLGRIAGGLMMYLDVYRVRESNKLLEELKVYYHKDIELIELHIRGTSLQFNKKASLEGTLS